MITKISNTTPPPVNTPVSGKNASKQQSFNGITRIICENPEKQSSFYKTCFDFFKGLAERHSEIKSVGTSSVKQNVFNVACENSYDQTLVPIVGRFTKEHGYEFYFEPTTKLNEII